MVARCPAVVLAMCCLFCAASSAATYRVGPGEKYAKISDVSSRLLAGDVVEITGDIADSATLTASGSSGKPIVVRGIARVEAGKIIRPQIRPSSPGVSHAVKITGNCNVLEGLAFTGFMGKELGTAALVLAAADTVLRNIHFHHNIRSIVTRDRVASNVLIEFCEFESDGYGGMGASVLLSRVPGSLVTVQHCYLHSNTGNNLLRVGFARNIIRYNWFEDFCNFALQVTIPELFSEGEDRTLAARYLPTHADIVGNVFASGWASRTYGALQLGGTSGQAPGTEGTFSIAHNLFLGRRRGKVPFSAITLHGNVDRLRLFNNVFLDCCPGGCQLYVYDNHWDDARSLAFAKEFGRNLPLVEGSNNWISASAFDVPGGLQATISGFAPRFWSFVDLDFRPLNRSPLAGSGLWPLPNGKMGPLVPQYEPQRGIPLDLQPRRRRAVTPPSIGPFEAVETAPRFDDDSEELVLGVREVDADMQWQLNFGRARRMALGFLAQGKPREALSCAKMQFILSPTDQRTANLAIGSVKQMLVAADGNDSRARRFDEYALIGPSGRDGQPGTADDLEDPLADIGLETFTRPDEFCKESDAALDAMKAMCSPTSLVYWWETRWLESEKIFARVEAACFDDTFNRIFALLPEAVKRPRPFPENSTADRTRNLIDRLRETLSAVVRSRSGSMASVNDTVNLYVEYARYGPQGADSVIGTPDDIDLLPNPHRTSLPSIETGVSPELKELVSAFPQANAVRARIAAIADMGALTVHKLSLIASPDGRKKLGDLLFLCPAPNELLRQAISRTSARDRGQSLPQNAAAAASAILARAVGAADARVLEAYKRAEAGSDPASAAAARAYLTAYFVACHDDATYPLAIDTLIRTLGLDGVPSFLVGDTCDRLLDPVLAGSIFDMMNALYGERWPATEKEHILARIEAAECDFVREALNCTPGMEEEQRRTAYAYALSVCTDYLKRFENGKHRDFVQFQKASFECELEDYSRAAESLGDFTQLYPGSAYAANALFVRGLALLKLGRQEAAVDSWRQLTKDYPGSNLAASALLGVGRVMLSMHRTGEARECFQRIVDLYPDDESVPTANAHLMALGDLHK